MKTLLLAIGVAFVLAAELLLANRLNQDPTLYLLMFFTVLLWRFGRARNSYKAGASNHGLDSTFASISLWYCLPAGTVLALTSIWSNLSVATVEKLIDINVIAAVAALIITIISGIYIRALEVTRQEGEKLLAELRISDEIKEIKQRLATADADLLAMNRIQPIHRLAQGLNANSDDGSLAKFMARQIQSVMNFEHLALQLLEKIDQKKQLEDSEMNDDVRNLARFAVEIKTLKAMDFSNLAQLLRLELKIKNHYPNRQPSVVSQLLTQLTEMINHHRSTVA